MSEFTAIRDVSETLRALLSSHFLSSRAVDLSRVVVELKNPRELRERPENQITLSLWLYRVAREAHTLNQPPERLGPSLFARHPLPVNLCYLITPLAQDPKDEQDILGRVIQVFNDHAILRGSVLAGALHGESVEFRLALETLSLEELTRIWDALKEPYQLSVNYLVQVVRIDSEHEPVEGRRVEIKETEYLQIMSVT